MKPRTYTIIAIGAALLGAALIMWRMGSAAGAGVAVALAVSAAASRRAERKAFDKRVDAVIEAEAREAGDAASGAPPKPGPSSAP